MTRSKLRTIFSPRERGGGGGAADTMGIRHQNNPSPRELDKTPRQGEEEIRYFL